MKIMASDGNAVEFIKKGENITITLHFPPSVTASMAATVKADDFQAIYPLKRGHDVPSVFDEENGMTVRFKLLDKFSVQISFTPIRVSGGPHSYPSPVSTIVNESELRAAYDETLGTSEEQ